jgi:hypothetical protein
LFPKKFSWLTFKILAEQIHSAAQNVAKADISKCRYESTSDLGSKRAYRRRLWANQCTDVLHVVAIELRTF